MADNEQVVLTIPRGLEGTAELRIAFAEFNGHPYVGLREWVKKDDGEWIPTKKGMSLKPKELPQVIAALQGFKGAKPVDPELPEDLF